jgi:hypothetical protein
MLLAILAVLFHFVMAVTILAAGAFCSGCGGGMNPTAGYEALA